MQCSVKLLDVFKNQAQSKLKTFGDKFPTGNLYLQRKVEFFQVFQKLFLFIFILPKKMFSCPVCLFDLLFLTFTSTRYSVYRPLFTRVSTTFLISFRFPNVLTFKCFHVKNQLNCSNFSSLRFNLQKKESFLFKPLITKRIGLQKSIGKCRLLMNSFSV